MLKNLTREEVIKTLFDGDECELDRRIAEVAWQEPAAISLGVKGRPGLLTQIDESNFTLEIAGALAGWR